MVRQCPLAWEPPLPMGSRETAFRPAMRLVIAARLPGAGRRHPDPRPTQVASFIRAERHHGASSTRPNCPRCRAISPCSTGATRDDSSPLCARCKRGDRGRGRPSGSRNTGSTTWSSSWARSGATPGGGLSGVEKKDADLLGSIAIRTDRPPTCAPYSSFAFVAPCKTEVRQLPLTENVSFRGSVAGRGEMPSTCRSSAAEHRHAQGGRNQPPDPAWPLSRGLGPAGQHGLRTARNCRGPHHPPGEALGFEIGAAGPVCCATASEGSRRRPPISRRAAHGSRSA